mgnify:CR=1 FL=1|jgi:hypothetical protein
MKNTTARDAASRLENMLLRDKVKAPEGFSEILKSDLTKLLGDYFELSEGVSVNITLTQNSGFDIKISTSASRIKSFYCAK